VRVKSSFTHPLAGLAQFDEIVLGADEDRVDRPPDAFVHVGLAQALGGADDAKALQGHARVKEEGGAGGGRVVVGEVARYGQDELAPDLRSSVCNKDRLLVIDENRIIYLHAASRLSWHVCVSKQPFQVFQVLVLQRKRVAYIQEHFLMTIVLRRNQIELAHIYGFS